MRVEVYGLDMTENNVTTVKVKHETWAKLNQLKEPGDSFDDIISDLLEQAEEGNPKPAMAID